MKAAIYCRLSEEDKNKRALSDDSESIQNQKSMLLNHCLKQGWEVYGIYSDDDYTGSDRRRPEFNRLLDDARLHRFDIILCKTQSRFTRELELVEKYIHGLFPLWGIRFVSIVDNADTANKGNKKSRQINGLVNEWYLEDMSENIKSVLNDKRKKGSHIGSFALYGYKKDPNQKGHLVIDEKAAGIVREIFTLYAQGYGKTAIARMLNDRDVPNPTEYKRIQGLRYKQPENKTCTLWKYATISGMLRNEIYIGNMVQGKYGSVSYKTKQNRPKPPNEWYRVENTHEPIIDCALWTRVQQLLEQRSKPFATGKIGLFAGKTRCAGCSCTMRSSKSHDRHYLKCPTRPCAPSACTGSFLSADALELAVTAELNRLSATYLDLDELEQRLTFKDDLKEQIKQLQTETALYQKKLDTYTTSLRELYLDKVKGLLTEDDYLLFSRDFTAEKLRLNRQITDCQKRMQELEKSMPSDNSPRQRIKHYTRPDHLNREIVEKLIDYITVGKRLPGTQEVPVEIHWNF